MEQAKTHKKSWWEKVNCQHKHPELLGWLPLGDRLVRCRTCGHRQIIRADRAPTLQPRS